MQSISILLVAQTHHCFHHHIQDNWNIGVTSYKISINHYWTLNHPLSPTTLHPFSPLYSTQLWHLYHVCQLLHHHSLIPHQFRFLHPETPRFSSLSIIDEQRHLIDTIRYAKPSFDTCILRANCCAMTAEFPINLEIPCTKFSNLMFFTKISQTMTVMTLKTFTWTFLMKTQHVSHGIKMKNFCLSSRPMKNNHLCLLIILLLLFYYLILHLVVLSRGPLCFTFPTKLYV